VVNWTTPNFGTTRNWTLRGRIWIDDGT
jgi:hypothetical protein